MKSELALPKCQSSAAYFPVLWMELRNQVTNRCGPAIVVHLVFAQAIAAHEVIELAACQRASCPEQSQPSSPVRRREQGATRRPRRRHPAQRQCTTLLPLWL